MPSLLTIPRELRDQICIHALFGETNSPPDLHQTFEQLISSRRVYKAPKLRAWCNLVLDAPGTAIPNADTLLLVNRQLHAETLETIKLLAQSNRYELDVTILDEIIPLITWTSIPFHSNSLDEVNVTFRISGCYDPNKEGGRGRVGKKGAYVPFGSYKGFRGGNGAGPAIGWQTYSILERFIKCGTVGDHLGRGSPPHQHVTIKKLEINVQTPPGIDPVRFGSPRSSHWGIKEQVEDVLDPVYLTGLINSSIRDLLSGADAEWFDYGKILFEHVDRVTIREDGLEVGSYDVPERLSNAGGFAERYLSKEELESYKRWAWQWRKSKGLKVLEEPN